MKTLPLIIRSYIAQEKYTSVTRSLMMKYRLRTEQGGVLERGIMLLLMGVESPDEFTQTLADEARLDQQTIDNIIQDVNDQMFVPLREQMRNAGNTAPQSARPAAAIPPRANVVNASVPNYAKQSDLAKTLSHVAPRAPIQTANSTPKFAHQENRIAPLPPKFGTARPILTAPPMPTSGEKLLENHEEPHIDIRDKVQVRTAPPPANLPGAMTSPVMSTPRPVTPPAPVRPPYSSDPYREQIDGK